MSKTQNIEYKMFQVENELVEYKEKLTASLEKEAVAFLNAKGGNIYIGVKNNGDVVGVPDIDKIQLQVKDRLICGISPSIMSLFSISAEKTSDKTVLRITLREGTEKPYYIKNKGLSESGTFIRIGSSAQPMTQKMIYAFQTKSFPKSLINIESPEQELTFGDLFIHYRRFAKPLNDNTFAHNDYSYGMLPIFEVFQNRFAIRSYGGLVPQLTINDFFLGVSALRNPELMRILKDLELVEALGFGIRGITKFYDTNIFEFTDSTMYVQFPFDEEVGENEESSTKSGTENNQETTRKQPENCGENP
ncbi:hypothetical protein FACS1894201_08960 [Bacteroidia bacterium]|nr:hypothetical protein FACS1894201_08960 [Bacteroidia bacterium]